MITLYQFEISPFCDKVRRILHVKNVPYRVEEISLTAALTRLKKINPAGKLPCIQDGARFVADSTDIAYYLEEQHPEPALVPTDPRLRAQCHVLEDWADESLYFYEVLLRFTLPHNAKRWSKVLAEHDNPIMQALAGVIVPNHSRSTLARQGLGRKTLKQVLDDLGRHLAAIEGWLGGGKFLLGNDLSLADIAVFAQLYCVRGADEGQRIITDNKTVAAWMDRVDLATAKGT